MEKYKDDYIIKECKGKKVLHIGATDYPKHKKNAKKNTLLHQKLNKVCDSLLGLDNSRKAIKDLKKYNIDNIVYGDIMKGKYEIEIENNNYDIIIFGDVVEHLDNPGLALQNINKLSGNESKIILTAPNVWSIFRIKNLFKGDEQVHPDHTFWPSKETLKELINRNGFNVLDFGYVFYGSYNIDSTWRSRLFFSLFGNRFDYIRSGLIYVLEKSRLK